MTSQVERARLEPISSNGGRKFSLFERRYFNFNFFFLFERKGIVHDGKLFLLRRKM